MTIVNKTLKTAKLKRRADYLAPNGSEIRLLPNVRGGGLAHCTLPNRRTSSAVRHKTVEEIWYFIQGTGQVWRQMGSKKRTTRVHAGMCITIPLGCHFQFRSTGDAPLCFIIATIPRWPGESEALKVADHWTADPKCLIRKFSIESSAGSGDEVPWVSLGSMGNLRSAGSAAEGSGPIKGEINEGQTD